MALKTEDLLAQGLTQEQVNYVMAEFGKEINPIKAERDNLRTQLNTAQTTLKSFEGVNVTELQGKITQLTNDLANKEAEYQSSIAERVERCTIFGGSFNGIRYMFRNDC